MPNLNQVVNLTPLGRGNTSLHIASIRLVSERVYENIFVISHWCRRAQPAVGCAILRSWLWGFIRKGAECESGSKPISNTAL